MAEQLDLTAPIVPPTRTTYSIKKITLDWANSLIEVFLTGSDGVDVRVEYLGVTAATLMTTLNSANLSVLSLHKRVLQKLVVDGKVPGGIVSGVAS